MVAVLSVRIMYCLQLVGKLSVNCRYRPYDVQAGNTQKRSHEQVNLGGYFFLAEKDMILDRTSGVTYESLTAAFHSSFEEFRDWNIGFNRLLC